ncbi:MAG: monooxygenase [Proteobacteria bacterium]|nr:monooxygenase [Pseudomonadota bacterium]
MNAPVTNTVTAVESARDFSFIKPAKRRLTEYEAVTIRQQWETGGFDKGGHFLTPADGRAPWREESTALRHPDWFAFRDPAQLWQRPYVRMQAEQERAIERLTEDSVEAGAFADINRAWLDDFIAGHYRVWSFFENGLFRAFAPAQREALSDCLGNALCFQAFDQMRHAQAIVSHLVAAEMAVPGLSDAGAKQTWLDEPAYQPLRRLVEQLVATSDWCEIPVATNLVILPLLSEVTIGGLIRRQGPLHGDSISPYIALTADRDRRRNADWTQALVRMVIDDKLPAAAANRGEIEGWLKRWQPRALDAVAALQAIADRVPAGAVDLKPLLASARAQQNRLLTAAGLDASLLAEFEA